MSTQSIRAISSNKFQTIGAILVDSGRLDIAAADRVLKLQQQQPELRFGDAAVQLGLITDSDLHYALSQQFVYPYLEPTDERLSQELITAFNPTATISEQLRALRSQLLLRWFDGSNERKALAIVSPETGDGRSFIAANLAVVFSQLGERVLLLDADLRRPRQHELFKASNKLGFSSVLAGRADWREVVTKAPGLLSLSMIPAGAVPPNPDELLNRTTFDRLLAELRDSFDIVIVDTPAGVGSNDVRMIAAKTKGALLIARQHRNAVGDLKTMVADLNQNGATVVGSLLNRH